jgi:hypothetical protein
VKKGVQANVLVAYVLHEVDEGAEKVEEEGDIGMADGEGGRQAGTLLSC